MMKIVFYHGISRTNNCDKCNYLYQNSYIKNRKLEFQFRIGRVEL